MAIEIYKTETPDLDVDEEEISKCDDLNWLQKTYTILESEVEGMRCTANGYKDVGFTNEDNLAQLGARIGYFNQARRWVECRMVALGREPIRSHTDTRNIIIRNLESKLKAQKKMMEACKCGACS